MIQFEHVCKNYGKTPILRDLNFTIRMGSLWYSSARPAAAKPPR